jgi:hypothetical protein
MRPHVHLTVLLLGLAAAAAPAEEAPKPARGPLLEETSCYACHTELDEGVEGATTQILADIHSAKGLGCHDCHAGDPTAGFDGDPFAAHDEEKGFRGAPSRLEIPRFCARCHSDPSYMKRFDPDARVDQLAEYETSAHGLRNAAGDGRTAVCTDCHGIHGILAVEDSRGPVHPTRVADTCARCHANADRMGRYGLSTNQVADYRQSVHAHALYEKGDTSAPTCNDCHGNHGAIPPGVDSVANVCGTCHLREGSLFRETERKLDVDLEACIQCAICHDNHAIRRPTHEMIGVGPASTCTACHAEGEETYDHVARMGEAVLALKTRIEEAEGLLHEAERAGMEVRPDLYELREASDQLVELRVLAHSFDVERYLEAAGKGMEAADAGVEAGHGAFAELRTRRLGLAASLIVILAVIVALALKIRQMERPGE